jgi:hypothetical protein
MIVAKRSTPQITCNTLQFMLWGLGIVFQQMDVNQAKAALQKEIAKMSSDGDLKAFAIWLALIASRATGNFEANCEQMFATVQTYREPTSLAHR